MYDEMLKKMKNKKKSESMSDSEKNAKMKVVDEMEKMADDAMSDSFKNGMKKVTVAADSKEGIKQGLESAKKLLNGDSIESKEELTEGVEPHMGGDEGEESEPDMMDEHESSENPEDEIKMLEEKLKKLKEKMQG